MGTVSFQPTADDLTAAYRAYFGWTLRRRRYRVTMAVLLLAMAVVGAAIVRDGPARVALPIWGGMMGAWIGVMAALTGLRWLLISRTARRIFRQQRGLHDEVTVTWTGEGVGLESGRGGGRFAWADFHARWQGRHTILLFQSEALFNFIPTRVLTPEQVAEIMGPH